MLYTGMYVEYNVTINYVQMDFRVCYWLKRRSGAKHRLTKYTGCDIYGLHMVFFCFM